MFKNTASQKWVVFAFEDEGGTNPGEPVTGDAANITANLRLDGGAPNAIDDLNPTELEDGYYIFDITQTECNADLILMAPVSSTANVNVIGVPGAIYTSEATAARMGALTDWIDGGRLDLILDTINTDAARLTAVRAAILTDWIDGGRLDLLLDAIPTTAMRGTDDALKPTVTGRTLDVTATGEAGLDLDNTSGTWAAAQFAAAFITASKFGAGAIDAAALATDAVAEISDGVWDELLAGHITADSAGLLLNDWQDGGRLDLLLDAIPTTAMRGTDNAALASVCTEARLAELDAANLPTATDAAVNDLANATDGLGAIKAAVDAIPTTPMRGTDGANTTTPPTAAAIADAVCDETLTAHVTADSLAVHLKDTLADSSELQVDWADGGRLDLILDIIAADTTTDIPALINGLNDISEANVLTQVNAALDTSISELSAGAPTATPTIRTALMLLYMALRNKRTTDATSDEITNDAGAVVCSAVLSDDTIDFIKAEYL